VTNNRDWSAMTYAWGQFLDHDMMRTDAAAPKDTMTFDVPKGDAVFDSNSTGTKTMSASRSNFDAATGTSAANPRQQLNSLSSFIDGSQVYGETQSLASSLREKRAGRMSDGGSGVNLLPRLTNTSDLFLTGDVRGNRDPELCSLHVLFVREHNRIAAQLAAANPALSDEELFQRARRRVIALLQKVTYSEVPARRSRHRQSSCVCRLPQQRQPQHQQRVWCRRVSLGPQHAGRRPAVLGRQRQHRVP